MKLSYLNDLTSSKEIISFLDFKSNKNKPIRFPLAPIFFFPYNPNNGLKGLINLHWAKGEVKLL
jgi:hypothetical protein